MKRLFFSNYIVIVIFLMVASSCEIDNYEGPNSSMNGAFYDHNGKPLEVSQGASYIRMREVSWANGDSTVYIANRTIALEQDGTYNNTKLFAGEYRIFPSSGNFYPYWDDYQNDPVKDGDAAGVLLTLKKGGVTTQNFTVTPYLSIEWITKPYVRDDSIVCVVRFIRNEKPTFYKPNVYRARLLVGRTQYPTRSSDGDLTEEIAITNEQEGQNIEFKTRRKVKYTGIDYWIRVQMNCQTPSGQTAYPGIGANNYTSVEHIFVP